MASTVLKCAILALVMFSLVLAQRGLYPGGRPPPGYNRQPVLEGKAGHCPPAGDRPSYGNRRTRSCRRDADCPDLDKCCNINRRNICLPPVFA